MHIAKVESLVESRRDEGNPGRSGMYVKAEVAWGPTEREPAGGPKVVSADKPCHIEEPTELVSPEGSCRLVVLERGAQWPEWLAQGLSGGATTYVVAEAVGDGLGGLVQRVARRAVHSEMPISQLIWVSVESKRLAPMRWIKRLSARVQPFETLVIVPAMVSPQGLRRTSRFAVKRLAGHNTWPRAVVA
jgi:hypothetical protein